MSESDMISDDFKQFVDSIPEREGPFRPFIYRNEQGGSFEVFLDNEAFCGHYISPGLTLYVGKDSGKIVGFEVSPPFVYWNGLNGKR